MIKLQESLSPAEFGSKAASLSRLIQLGQNVPNGFVIHKDWFEAFQLEQLDIEDFKKVLKNALESMSADTLMVRSSAIGEDSDENSFAGQLESYRSGPDVNSVYENTLRCWKSYNSNSVKAYEKSSGFPLNGMAVVVQEMVDPDFAGVVFTRSPIADSELLIEYTNGHGEKLVSGDVEPECKTYSRKNNEVSCDDTGAFKSLVDICVGLEISFGLPLDIEFAVKDEIVFLLQARPITTEGKGVAVHWSNTNVNENYPDAISPLLYSIARDSYYHYFKNLSKLFRIPQDRIQRLQSSFTNVIGVFGGKMYYNMSSIYDIFYNAPFSNRLLESFNNFVGHTDDALDTKKVKFREKFAFIRSALKYNRSLDREVSLFENRVQRYVHESEQAISLDELKLMFHEFIEIRMHSWYKASLADFFAMLHHGILGKLCSKFYTKEAVGIHNQLIQSIPNLVSTEPVLLIHEIVKCIRKDIDLYADFQRLKPDVFWQRYASKSQEYKAIDLIQSYLKNWGFRCSGELMLTTENLSDNPVTFILLLKQYDEINEDDPSLKIAAAANEAERIRQKFIRKIWTKYGVIFPVAVLFHGLLNLSIRNAMRGISSRERARLKQAQLYYQFKKVIRKIGRELQKRNLLADAKDLLYLSHVEITELMEYSSILPNTHKDKIALLKMQYKEECQKSFPDQFLTKNGQVMHSYNEDALYSEGDVMTGMSACGGKVTATARVIESISEAYKLQKGDILITRQTDPGWIIVFPLISGLIVERGGMLSHGAIVSREFGIPSIVGVTDATSRIKDGQIIQLDADTGTIIFLDA